MPVTIKGVCLDPGGQVLLGRNDRGEWELPGGRPERGESYPDCLVREIREETKLTAHVGDASWLSLELTDDRAQQVGLISPRTQAPSKEH